MDLLKWFKKPTQYKKQMITEKQYVLIVSLDDLLVEEHTEPPSDEMELFLHYIELPLAITMLPYKLIELHITKQFTTGVAYVPRSVAFFTGPDGSWNFVYATRGYPEVSQSRYLIKIWENMLGRTNDARSEYEKDFIQS